MTRPSGRTLALMLGTDAQDGVTVAALRLAEHALARGHRVAVYAYGPGVGTSAEGSPCAEHVTELLRRGVHGGLASWVVDRRTAERGGGPQVPGVVLGDPGDLWRFVRDADVALGVNG